MLELPLNRPMQPLLALSAARRVTCHRVQFLESEKDKDSPRASRKNTAVLIVTSRPVNLHWMLTSGSVKEWITAVFRPLTLLVDRNSYTYPSSPCRLPWTWECSKTGECWLPSLSDPHLRPQGCHKKAPSLSLVRLPIYLDLPHLFD